VEHDLNTWTDHTVETRDHVNIDEFELDVFLRFFCTECVSSVRF